MPVRLDQNQSATSNWIQGNFSALLISEARTVTAAEPTLNYKRRWKPSTEKSKILSLIFCDLMFKVILIKLYFFSMKSLYCSHSYVTVCFADTHNNKIWLFSVRVTVMAIGKWIKNENESMHCGCVNKSWYPTRLSYLVFVSQSSILVKSLRLEKPDSNSRRNAEIQIKPVVQLPWINL